MTIYRVLTATRIHGLSTSQFPRIHPTFDEWACLLLGCDQSLLRCRLYRCNPFDGNRSTILFYFSYMSLTLFFSTVFFGFSLHGQSSCPIITNYSSSSSSSFILLLDFSFLSLCIMCMYDLTMTMMTIIITRVYIFLRQETVCCVWFADGSVLGLVCIMQGVIYRYFSRKIRC